MRADCFGLIDADIPAHQAKLQQGEIFFGLSHDLRKRRIRQPCRGRFLRYIEPRRVLHILNRGVGLCAVVRTIEKAVLLSTYLMRRYRSFLQFLYTRLFQGDRQRVK